MTVGINKTGYYSLTKVYDVNEGGFKDIKPIEVSATNKYISKAKATREDKAITITPNPETGEFFVMVPPLDYTASVKVPNSSVLSSQNFGDAVKLNVTNPNVTSMDTLTIDSKTDTVKYNKSYVFKATVEPTLEVVDLQYKGDDVFDRYFGEATEEYNDPLKGKTKVAVIDSSGYTFGYAVFETMRTYKFGVSVKERYVNYENGKVDNVPYSDTVTIHNPMSSEYGVYYTDVVDADGNVHKAGEVQQIKGNKVLLDAKGEMVYQWTCGLPNIVSPYTREMQIKAGGKEFSLTGIVFGDLSTGSNFVTAGPTDILMILRDPSGSGSSCSWEEGQSYTKTTTVTLQNNTTYDEDFNVNLGCEVKTAQGAVGLLMINTTEVKSENVGGFSLSEHYTRNNTKKTTITASRTISTSSDPGVVGAEGDVFVGMGTNVIYGTTRLVGLQYDDSTGYYVGMRNAISRRDSVGTMFSYSQSYIKNSLLPGLRRNRNSMITIVPAEDYDKYSVGVSGVCQWTGTEVLYISKLKEGEKGFGTKGNYKILCPEIYERIDCDSVLWYNQQYDKWIETLARNERAKVTAIESGKDSVNYSFDGGASISLSKEICGETTTSNEGGVQEVAFGGHKFGFARDKTGVVSTWKLTETMEQSRTDEDGNSHCNKFSFTLADEGDDSYSVSVYNDPEGKFGPIFYTMAGQTSCPYEGEVRTEFLPEEHIIGVATAQIEKPEIKESSLSKENVPEGECAYFKLTLQNLSDVDSLRVNYILYCAEMTDAPVVKREGNSINGKENASKLPLSWKVDELRDIAVCQSNPSVYEYKDIPIVLSSPCQGSIADTCFLSVNFVKSCTPVKLAFEKTMNINTGDKLDYEINGYDLNFDGFKELKLQYRKKGSESWITAEEIALKDISGSSYFGKFDMSMNSTYPDGEYELKAVSVCEGDIVRNSEIYELTKDMARPLPMEIQPSDGILSVGDEVSVTFNEDIRNGAILDLTNVKVVGTVNGSKVTHNTALNLTGASVGTEAKIDLSDHSFSGDFWVNYAKAGTILEHGDADNKFAIAVNADGTVGITIGGETYTSKQSIPKETWCFVSYVYENDSKTFSAQFAYDDKTIQLFTDMKVAPYEGVGVLKVGADGFIGKMHQMSLWNTERPLEKSQNEMHNSKMPSDAGILGYWKMEEGYGTAVKDYARSRNMVMESYSDKNYAASLDGKSYITLDVSKCATLQGDDYMMEMWFRADDRNGGTFLDFGDSLLSLGFNSKGNMALNTVDGETIISKNDYLDGAWHHVAMNVRRNGFATFYVDGKAEKQIVANNVPAVSSGSIVLGATRYDMKYDNYFTGDIDEVRYWKASLTGEVIKERMHEKIDTTRKSGLVAYYPFEEQFVNSASLKEYRFGFSDYCDAKNEAVAEGAKEAKTAPALKSAVERMPISFKSIASERKIVIDLLEGDAKIDGNTLMFTVEEIFDTHNNTCEPITWTAFVNKATLLWSEDEKKVVTESGKGVVFTVDIVNNGAKEEAWTLSELPSWLSADATSGVLKPLSKKTLTFTVAQSAAIGDYEDIVYLSGNQKIEKGLVVSLKVTGKAPEWDVNPSDYTGTMTVIAQLNVNGEISRDKDDIVAAFIGDECVGVANPTYKERYDAFYIDMTVYGNGLHSGKEVLFKVWDASTGKVYTLTECSDTVTFKNNSLYGKNTEPLTISTNKSIEQRISLVKGWNWVSLYAMPADNSINNVLRGATSATLIKNQSNGFDKMINTRWYGTMPTVKAGEMYMINASENGIVTVRGEEIVAKENPIEVANEWNWIGVNTSYEMTIANAFADLDPVDGDMVKGSNGFAIYDGYEWSGSLKSITPGAGYKYNNVSGKSKKFIYPSKGSSLRAGEAENDGMPSIYKPTDYHKFPSSMTIIAMVTDSRGGIADAELGAFVGGECRGANTPVYDEDIFLMVYGSEENGDSLSFRAYVNGKEYWFSTKIPYIADGMLGTIDEPFILSLDDASAVSVGATVLSVYPNPADEFIMIDGIEEGAEIEAVNMLGEKVLADKYDGKSLNVSGLQSGVYVLKINGVASSRFIKK